VTVILPEPHIPAMELSQIGCHQERSHKLVYLALPPSMPGLPQHPYDSPAIGIYNYMYTTYIQHNYLCTNIIHKIYCIIAILECIAV